MTVSYLSVSSYIFAFFLWMDLFVLHTIPYPILLPLIATFLIVIPIFIDTRFYHKLHIRWYSFVQGIISAVLLFFFFSLGYLFIKSFWAELLPHLDIIYSMRTLIEPYWLVITFIVIIGFAEELYFRGTIQSLLMNKFGTQRGLLCSTALYGLVHIPAQNPILFFASIFAGYFWGWLFMKTGNVIVSATCHTCWTLLVFILFPFDTVSHHGFV